MSYSEEPSQFHSITDTELAKVEAFSKARNTSVLVIFFDDTKGSTALKQLVTERDSEEAFQKLRREHDEVLTNIITRNGAGVVIKSTGDGLLAVFSEPSTAVERSLEIQNALHHHPYISVRIGLDMGQVRVESAGGVQRDLFGRHVDWAARVESMADGGHILVTRSVYTDAFGWIKKTDVSWKEHGFYRVKEGEEELEVFEPCNGNITKPMEQLNGQKVTHRAAFQSQLVAKQNLRIWVNWIRYVPRWIRGAIKARPWAIGIAILLAISAGAMFIFEPTRSFVRTVLLERSQTSSESKQQVGALVGEMVVGVGDIIEVTERRNAPTIVVFEETHTSRQGQIEIAIMLNRLYETYGLRHIGQEGVFTAAGTLDSSWFYPSLATGQVLSPKEKVAVQLMAEGEISSGEMMTLIYPDIKVHGIEKAVEYNIDLPDDASNAPIMYLLAIAQTSMSSDQLELANELIKQGRFKESVEYIIGSNEFTKKQYLSLTEPTGDFSSLKIIDILERIEAEAKRVGAKLSDQDRKVFQSFKTFFIRAETRSDTMGTNILELANRYPEAPIAMIIGAAHKEKISRLLTKSGMSFAIVRPKSFVEGNSTRQLSDDAFKRASSGFSVDTKEGGIGALLDGQQKKPPPKLVHVWFRSKAEAYLLTALVARIEARDQPLLSTQLSKEMMRMQYVALLLSSFKVVENEKIFAIRCQVQNLAAPIEVWVRATEIQSESLWTLQNALENALSTSANSNSEVIKKTLPVHTTSDVIAVFSTNPSIIENTSLAR